MRFAFLTLASLSLAASLAAQEAPKLLPFQGRLTDQNGLAVSNGVRLVQFKIYDVPTGGSPVWAGELHRTTINGGLVNVMLGSKTPLSGVDFDKQLYLEITVDVSGPTGQPDNSITAADPPMLPRQAILPVVFAKEAADSRLLNGHNWGAILVDSGTNPASGAIRGDKIQLQGITASQIASNTITAGQIAGATITSNEIAPGTINASLLSPSFALDTVIPPGTVQAFAGANTPAGWLLCDGSAVSSAQYPRLYSAISTNWGAGFPASTNNFNLPDLRGLFLRGVNGTRTNFTQTGTNFVDSDSLLRISGIAGGNTGNNVGSLQLDELKSHTHNIPSEWSGFAAGGALAEMQREDIANPGSLNVGNAGGNETRPKNAYVNYIIKY